MFVLRRLPKPSRERQRPSLSMSLFAAVLVVPSTIAQVAPPALQPPKGQTLILRSKGKGKQIYTCQTVAGASAWKLKAPDANLYSETGELIGKPFAGPTWQSTDGSQVVGKMIAC